MLEPAGTKWHAFKWLALAGNYLLMMFYTTVGGWMLAFGGEAPRRVRGFWKVPRLPTSSTAMLADPVQLAVYMLIIVGVGVGVTRRRAERAWSA